ncbi:caspase-1-like [Hetaerina americana]|uniref:caspase-1-like n=1 Tax=Hetaerina americana TaxID=62018 RepID=UPI003A7F23FD
MRLMKYCSFQQGNKQSKKNGSWVRSCISPDREELHRDDGCGGEAQQNGNLKIIKTQAITLNATPHDISDYYDMNHHRRGIFLILENREFIALERRDGSEEDVKQLQLMFHNLGFEVRVKLNLRKTDITNTMKLVSEENHEDCDCFGMAVLTHGDEGDMLAASDNLYYTNHLYEFFNGNKCATLQGKPKLFFFNACKGKEVDEVDSVFTKRGVRNLESLKIAPLREPLLGKPMEVVTSHVYSDFLCGFSTWPGFKSYRHPKAGSLYIHYLCQELSTGTMKGNDLTTILMRVSRRMAENPAIDGNKVLRQTSMYHSSLTKKVVLRPIRKN